MVSTIRSDDGLRGALTENAQIESASLPRLCDDRLQCVSEVFEQPILKFHRHAEDAVQKFTHIVVVFVKD